MPSAGNHSDDDSHQQGLADPLYSPQPGAVTSASLAVSLACACAAVFCSNWVAARFSFEAASLALVAVVASALGAAGRGLAGSRDGATSVFAGGARSLKSSAAGHRPARQSQMQDPHVLSYVA